MLAFYENEKMGFIIKSIHLLLLLVATIIVFGTLFFENSPKLISPFFNNYVSYPNYIYYIGSYALLVIFVLVSKNTHTTIISYITVYIIFLYVICLCLWVPADMQADPVYTHKLVVGQIKAQQTHFFETFPFCLNHVTIFSFIYKITNSWRACIISESLFALSACVFTCLTVFNLTKSKAIAIFSLLISTCLLVVNLNALIPHSSCSAMLCHTAAIYIYTTNTTKKYLYFLVPLLIVLGAWIRITSLIIIFSIIIVELIYNYRKLSYRKIRINIVASTIIFIGLFNLLPVLSYNIYDFTPNPNKELRMSWFFYFGQNSSSYGTTSYESNEDWGYAASFANLQERNKALLNAAICRINERGIEGNIVFYIKKLIVSYRDGLFVNQEYQLSSSDYNKALQSFIGQIMLSKGGLFQFYAGIEQLLWNLVLSLLLCGAFFSLSKKELVLAIIIIGLNSYLLIFENKARYVYSFVPYLIIFSSVTLYKIKQQYLQIKSGHIKKL